MAVTRSSRYGSANHPKIAVAYDIGESDGVTFIAMEHVAGQTLAARIQEGPLSANEVIRVAPSR